MIILSRFAWLVVITSALALSNWSLFYVGRHYGLPVILAGILSVSLDGAALVCADIALRYAREHGTSGASSRITVLVLAGISAWLNSEHASLAHDGLPAHVMFAVPPLAALTLFELHTRYSRRSALREAGRVAESLPAFGGHIWLHHPWGAYSGVRAITSRRLSVKVAAELASADAMLPQSELKLWSPALEASTKTEAIRLALAELGDETPASEVVTWLADRGWPGIDRAHIRTVKSRVKADLNGHEPVAAIEGG
jgi:Protein of unknown function (DUF2637)